MLSLDTSPYPTAPDSGIPPAPGVEYCDFLALRFSSFNFSISLNWFSTLDLSRSVSDLKSSL